LKKKNRNFRKRIEILEKETFDHQARMINKQSDKDSLDLKQ